jgi:transposase
VLEAMLYAGAGAKQGIRRKVEPDWTHVHRELRRPGVTLMLVWEEYRAREPIGYGYSRWCDLYRTWEGRLSPTMRQAHPTGERLFVDYAGQTVEVVDGRTGEVRQAQAFVAALGASSYIYAEATWTQALPALGRLLAPAPLETEPPAAAAAGSARTPARSPSWAGCRRSWCRTIRGSGSTGPTGTSRG